MAPETPSPKYGIASAGSGRTNKAIMRVERLGGGEGAGEHRAVTRTAGQRRQDFDIGHARISAVSAITSNTPQRLQVKSSQGA